MRFYFLLSFLVISFNLSAQRKVAEQQLNWAGYTVEVHSISDKGKTKVCSVIMNSDTIKAFIVDEGLQWTAPIILRRRPNEKMYGGFFRNGKLYLFLDNGGEPGLHNYVVDLQTKQVEQHMVPFETLKERIIDRISCGDHFLFFTLNKKSSEFVIHDFTSESQFSTTRHEFTGSVWKELTSQQGVIRSVNVEKVDLEGDCSIEVAACPNKMYVHNDTLFLLVNKSKGVTKLFIFSLADQKVASKIITHGVRIYNNIGLDVFKSDNSFLLDHKLYYVYATMDSLGIEVLDPLSGKLLKRYAVMKNEDIAFKNTPIIQEANETFFGSKYSREIDKTRQLLRKMVDGDALIMATLNSRRQVELAIGSYKILNNRSAPGFSMSTGGMSFGVGSAMPLTFPTGNFARNNWTKSARFKMLLNAETSEHIEGEVGMSINERIEAYTKNIKIPAEAENLFLCNGKYYYAYYDRREKTFSVVEF